MAQLSLIGWKESGQINKVSILCVNVVLLVVVDIIYGRLEYDEPAIHGMMENSDCIKAHITLAQNIFVL